MAPQLSRVPSAWCLPPRGRICNRRRLAGRRPRLGLRCHRASSLAGAALLLVGGARPPAPQGPFPPQLLGVCPQASPTLLGLLWVPAAHRGSEEPCPQVRTGDASGRDAGSGQVTMAGSCGHQHWRIGFPQAPQFCTFSVSCRVRPVLVTATPASGPLPRDPLKHTRCKEARNRPSGPLGSQSWGTHSGKWNPFGTVGRRETWARSGCHQGWELLACGLAGGDQARGRGPGTRPREETPGRSPRTSPQDEVPGRRPQDEPLGRGPRTRLWHEAPDEPRDEARGSAGILRSGTDRCIEALSSPAARG